MTNKYSRRAFLLKNIAGGASLLGGAWLLSSFNWQQTNPANKPHTTNQGVPPNVAQQTPKSSAENPCDNLTGVAPAELDKRKKFAYVPVSPITDSNCGNCKLFLPPGSGKPCGNCMLFKGPVREVGYCTYWAPLD
ncbi:hypothetical protein [Adhaeribacter rhizoryzae]|uniref:High potential iron-sulfur proteins family profile domain-containing protein n=1 Tax=Adhaeribacter rhizoryzae TaxID=2607907 RepID=A0A5M6D2H5_9BACT|nr:hypothetical protein [Adhaeribacter rhizoryzae]KAA5541717.1 hypothetical protein F0145_20355 [Adhaeribacter rhizoryzae]